MSNTTVSLGPSGLLIVGSHTMQLVDKAAVPPKILSSSLTDRLDAISTSPLSSRDLLATSTAASTAIIEQSDSPSAIPPPPAAKPPADHHAPDSSDIKHHKNEGTRGKMELKRSSMLVVTAALFRHAFL